MSELKRIKQIRNFVILIDVSRNIGRYLFKDTKGARVLKNFDSGIFKLEQMIVSIAAIMMTTTVFLDIIFRSLKGQQSEPFASIMSGFGLLATPAEGLPFALSSPLVLLVFPFILGWAVYASLHRGEEKVFSRAVLNGIFWMFGGLFASIIILNTASAWVCLGLTLLVGVLSFRSVSELIPRIQIAALTILISWGCLFLNQDYIWSQELSLILLAWVAFVGASMATFQNKHIQISALAGVVPVKIKPYIRPLGLIATSFFCIYLTLSLSGDVFGENGSWSSGERRPATGMPAWVILLSGIYAFGMISIRSLCYGISGLIDPQPPTQEINH